jgi:hypothetical protein
LYACAGVSTALAGCTSEIGLGNETIVDEDFSTPHEEVVEVEADETLRVEVEPLSPANQLVFLIVPTDELDEGSGGSGLTDVTRVNGTTAKEISPEETELYSISVGWFEEDKNPGGTQYHLTITLK